MADPVIFRIRDTGVLAFALVDRLAVGYLDSWQAPGGKRLPTAVLADYASDSPSWRAQVTGSKLTASANVTTTERKATFASPAAQTPTVGISSYTLDAGMYQDPNVSTGLSAFLYENDTKEAYVYFAADGDNPPRMIGRVRLVAGDFGGDADTDLEAAPSFPLSTRPDIQFGTTASGTRIVRGDGLASVVTAGVPGSFSGGSIPANLAALQASGLKPAVLTAWTTGQNVVLGTGTANWTGTAWAAGSHA